MSMWSIIFPRESTNLIANPSVEHNLTGWAGTGDGTISRIAGTAAFGAYSVAGTFNSVAGGLVVGTVTPTTTGSYAYSAHIWGGSGSVYRLGLRGTGAGAAFIGSIAITTGGTWHRYSGVVALTTTEARFLSLVRAGGGNAPIFMDGAQVERANDATTYIDGDQEGCIWLGDPHAALSWRPAETRSGGSIVPLRALGLTVLEHDGVGVAPTAVVAQEFGALDGAGYQKTAAQQRSFVLTTLFSGSTYAGLHALRKRLINIITPHLTARPQPVRFWYTGAGGTQYIDAIYDAGLEFSDRRGFSQTAGVRFIAPDPYFRSVLDQGTALPARTALGTARFLARRDGVTGQWGTLGVGGTTINNGASPIAVPSLEYANGTLWIGGAFGTVGGTVFAGESAGNLALYHTTTNTFGTPVGGSIGPGDVRALLWRNGTLYVGGEFPTARGTRANGVAFYVNNAYGTLTGGTLHHSFAVSVRALEWTPGGTLIVGGLFDSVAGTGARNIAMWRAGTWFALSPGTINSLVFSLLRHPSGTIYVGGAFSTVANTIVSEGVAAWSGSWRAMRQGVRKEDTTTAGSVYALETMPDMSIAVGGAFAASRGAGSVSGTTAIAWNGATWRSMARGVGSGGFTNALAYDRRGRLYAGGAYVAGVIPSSGLPPLTALTSWTGAAWTWEDIQLVAPPGADPTIVALTFDEQNTLYVALGHESAAFAPRVATVVNGGDGYAYPRITIRNPSSGTARIFQVRNYATDDAIFLNYIAAPGERLILDLTPGSVSMTSNFLGNVIYSVVPGSNLATWKLKPGTNYISFFADNDALETTLTYRIRNWSADGTMP